MSRCELCGHFMPRGEESFKYHGMSGPCPEKPNERKKKIQEYRESAVKFGDKPLLLIFEEIDHLDSALQVWEQEMVARGLSQDDNGNLLRFVNGVSQKARKRADEK